jgi:hypothetical protein
MGDNMYKGIQSQFFKLGIEIEITDIFIFGNVALLFQRQVIGKRADSIYFSEFCAS